MGFRAVLISILLAVQVGLQAHELEHVAGTDTELCAVCSAGGGLQHAVVGHPPTVSVTASHVFKVCPIARSVAASELETASARGPPRTH